MTADELFGPETDVSKDEAHKTGPSKLPTADEFFGPATATKKLPTADEFFGPDPVKKPTLSPSAQAAVDRIDKRDALRAAEARLTTDNSEAAREAYTKANREYRDATRYIDKDSAVAKYLPAVAAVANTASRISTDIEDSGGLWNAVKGVYNSIDKTVHQLQPDVVLGRAMLKAASDPDSKNKNLTIEVLKNVGKDVGSASVGAVHGAGDILMQVPAAGARALAAVADASGDSELASELDLSRKDVTGLREEGIKQMTSATGGSQEAAEAGRSIGGLAPVAVPGVGKVISSAGDVVKGVGTDVLSAASGAVRKTAGTAAKAAGETGGFITDVASFAADWAKDLPGVPSTVRKVGQLADLAGTVSPKVSSMTQYARRFNPEGSLHARDAFFGRGKDLRAKLGQDIEEQVQKRYDSMVGTVGTEQAAKEASALRTSLTSEATPKLNYADAYSKVRDALVRPATSVGDVLSKSAGKGGNILDDMVATGEDLIKSARDEITDLQRLSIKQEPSGASRYSKLQSQLQSAIAREKYLIRATNWVETIKNLPAAQRIQALQGAAGDAIAHATTGAAMGAAMGLSQSEIGDTDVYNKLVGGAAYGTALMALARGLQKGKAAATEDGAPVQIDADEVIKANSEIANKMADAMDADAGVKPTPEAVPEAAKAPASPEATPEAQVAQTEAPVTRTPGSLKPKPFTVSNKALVAEVKAKKLAEKRAAREAAKPAATVEVPEAPAAAPEITRAPGKLRVKSLREQTVAPSEQPARKLRTPEEAAAETESFIQERFSKRSEEAPVTPEKKPTVSKEEAEQFASEKFEKPEPELTAKDKSALASFIRATYKYRKASEARSNAVKFLDASSPYDLGPRAKAYVRDHPKATADDIITYLELE